MNVYDSRVSKGTALFQTCGGCGKGFEEGEMAREVAEGPSTWYHAACYPAPVPGLFQSAMPCTSEQLLHAAILLNEAERRVTDALATLRHSEPEAFDAPMENVRRELDRLTRMVEHVVRERDWAARRIEAGR